LGADGKLMAAQVKVGTAFSESVPRPLFDANLPADSSFAVCRDGRFLVPMPMEPTEVLPLTVVVNWQAGLRE
jgi:hypothetical protein